jgi:tetratricopeptide (TPR) repeat protein
LLCAGGFWSIPSENLRLLLEAIKADMLKSSGLIWDGYSEMLKEYFMKNKIDPKITYRRFYVNKRHTAACSYTWRGTNLNKIADKADNSCNAGKSLFIDVLVITQFGAELTSDQVIETTDRCYDDCEVWVFLDDSYFDRAWCLAEAAKFTNRASKCVLFVSGCAKIKPGTNFFRWMKAGKESDKLLIQDYVLRKYGSETNFNKTVEDAIVRLSPWSLLYQGRYREALQACEEEILVLKKLSGDNSINIFEAESAMATCCQKLGDLPRSLALYQKVLEGQVRRYGTGHVSVAGTQNNMALVLERQGKLEEALELYQKSLETKIRAVGPDHASVAATESNIGNVLLAHGDYENALVRFYRALEIDLKTVGPFHVSVAETEENMAIVYKTMGKLDRALETYTRVLETKIRVYGPSHVSVADTQNNMAVVLEQQGKLEEALELYQKSLETKIRAVGPDHV